MWTAAPGGGCNYGLYGHYDLNARRNRGDMASDGGAWRPSNPLAPAEEALLERAAAGEVFAASELPQDQVLGG
jgi:hypothetical protein